MDPDGVYADRRQPDVYANDAGRATGNDNSQQIKWFAFKTRTSLPLMMISFARVPPHCKGALKMVHRHRPTMPVCRW